MKGFGYALLLGLLACSSGPKKEPAPAKVEPPLRAQPWERDPYTRTSEVLIDGALVGYLVEYQAIPAGASADRAFPTGTYRIQDLRFEDVGYVTKNGDVRRFVKGGASESLGNWRLEEGLRRFYGSSSRTVLRELVPAPPPKPAAADKDAGDAEKAEKGTKTGDAQGQ
ncbi:MAG TPA: hypothetical protein VFG37_02840 [Planctomycetota bacterium]|nr:hypothetical protein [Planctomycetota bacterium]